MDSKSILQQKVLALALDFTARDIRYTSSRSGDGRWDAKVTIRGCSFNSLRSMDRKGSAGKMAAQEALNNWDAIESHLRANASACYSDDGEWSDGGPPGSKRAELRRLYEELGKHTYETHRLLRAIDSIQKGDDDTVVRPSYGLRPK